MSLLCVDNTKMKKSTPKLETRIKRELDKHANRVFNDSLYSDENGYVGSWSATSLLARIDMYALDDQTELHFLPLHEFKSGKPDINRWPQTRKVSAVAAYMHANSHNVTYSLQRVAPTATRTPEFVKQVAGIYKQLVAVL